MMRVPPVGAVAFLVLLAPFARADGAPKRLLAAGWDSPTPAEFRLQSASFAATGIFDGTVIKATRTGADGAPTGSSYAFDGGPWEDGSFAAAEADLRAGDPALARGSFLAVYANPGSVDWFDDAGWKQVADHWRLLARAAKRGGLRGLMFDAEPYEKPWAQFRYSAQAGRRTHAFDEYRAQARRRGREVMRAVAGEFPDATIFCWRLVSDVLDPRDGALKSSAFGLLPSFLDGWLAEAPATMTLVEGDEAAGYAASGEKDFARASRAIREKGPAVLAPESREKFRAQVVVSHGVYLDLFKRSSDLRDAASAAFLHADSGWLWIYGESARWWASAGGADRPLWSEKLPGAADALRAAKTAPAAELIRHKKDI